jgi:hypothetical protein
MSFLLERTRGRSSPGQADHTHRRDHRLIGAVLVVACSFGAFGVVAAGPESAAEAAQCDAVSIPSLDLERCVTDGGQAVIDAGGVARYTSLSSGTVHWLAGHRTSHGATFRTLVNIRIGAVVHFRGRTYVVVDYRLVNRFEPDGVADWVYSTTPSVVLQTSASSAMVHVWRSVELVPAAPIVAVDTPPVPGQ